MNITDILKEAAQKKVSDLFIIAGRPLAFKINSQIVNYSEEILMPKETEELISGIYLIFLSPSPRLPDSEPVSTSKEVPLPLSYE